MNTRMWNHLPDTALIEIYLYLTDRWRVSMALTCKNWNRVFAYPCLWRTRYLELGGYNAKSSGEKACTFADTHGSHIRYLFLSCSHPSAETCRYMTETIEEFLQKSHHCKLIRFELERLNLDRFWKLEHLKVRVLNSFTRFFHDQRNIEHFDMGDAHFSLMNGCRILESIGSASGKTIKILGLVDFFNTRLAMFQVKRYRDVFAKFTNLTHLALKYSCLSEEILECMASNLKGKLENISIMVTKTDPHFHEIPPVAWKNLKCVCPELLLHVWFETIGHTAEVTRILVPEAPIHELRWWTGYDDNADWHLGNTFNHMAAHHKQIVVLSLELDNINESIADSLVTLVTSCRTLRHLFVNAVLSVDTIDDICTMQIERKLDLDTLHITTCGLSEIECAELMHVTEKHLPTMQERGLNFKIISDYYAETAV